MTKEEKIAKLDNLITEGKNLLITRSYEQPNYSYDVYEESSPTIRYYSEVDHDAFPGWRMESLMVLKSFFKSDSDYVKQFEQNCKPDSTESNLKQGLGILEAAKKGYSENIIPEETLLITQLTEAKEEQGKEQKDVHKRIIIDNLPGDIAVLIDELNDNLDRNNHNASALLIRKILTMSCFISLKKIEKNDELADKELNEVLSITQKELKISAKIMSKVRSAKWIGDSANHSYKVKINESDVEVAATGLRIFLEEIF